MKCEIVERELSEMDSSLFSVNMKISESIIKQIYIIKLLLFMKQPCR